MKAIFADPENRERLLSILSSWDGTPFAHHAKLKGIGVDCVQFGGAVALELDLIEEFKVPPYTLNGTSAKPGDSNLLVGWFRKHPESFLEVRVHDEPLQFGDFICFDMDAEAHHLGILTDAPVFWHCTRFLRTVNRAGQVIRGGVRTNMISDSTWEKRLSHAFRPISQNDGETQ